MPGASGRAARSRFADVLRQYGGTGAVGPVTLRIAEVYTAHARTHGTPVG